MNKKRLVREEERRRKLLFLVAVVLQRIAIFDSTYRIKDYASNCVIFYVVVSCTVPRCSSAEDRRKPQQDSFVLIMGLHDACSVLLFTDICLHIIPLRLRLGVRRLSRNHRVI